MDAINWAVRQAKLRYLNDLVRTGHMLGVVDNVRRLNWFYCRQCRKAWPCHFKL